MLCFIVLQCFRIPDLNLDPAEHLKLLPLDSASCSKDKLLIRDNEGASRVVCGGTSLSVPPPMTFYGNQVTLNFVSDESGSRRGFLLRYRLSAAPQTGWSRSPIYEVLKEQERPVAK